MLTILTTTDHKKQISEVISKVERLDELVTVSIDALEIPSENKILVVNDSIKSPLDWHDTEPPYVFPEIDFSEENLLAHIFFKLGNQQKAFEYLSEDTLLYNHFLIATHLLFSYQISSEMIDFTRKIKHNQAIVHHYGNLEETIPFQKLQDLYTEALEKAENDEIKVFTAKHYLNLLLDAGIIEKAETILKKVKEIAISDEAINALRIHEASILMEKLRVPYNPNQLEKILSLQQKSIAFYEERGLQIQAGLLLTDAAEVANFSNDFILSKDLINKAIQIFKSENIPEFLGEAGLKKAILLYTWSKNGSPQYYKAAIAAFQDTLKVFKRDIFPEKFAQVHHHLALIYSEMPSSAEEKGIWSAFSASSFKNALEIYEKDKFPYEFAMVSHNYATALMNYPPAKIHDNLAKADGFFEEALEIRTRSKYPMERALTLLNQLELYWLTHNETSEAEEKKFQQMLSKAKEVKDLVNEENLIEQANSHLKRLEHLKKIISK